MDEAHKYLERVAEAIKLRDATEWKEIEKHFKSLPEDVRDQIVRLQFANIGISV